MRPLLFLLLVTLLQSAAAAQPPASGAAPVLAPMTDDMLVSQYTGRVEVRIDADLNGDGHVDTAAVMRDDEAETRRLVVALGFANEYDFGHEPIDEMAMDPYPMGNASLSVKKGVLVVEDLTGGTSAIASTYRFRYDPGEHLMRLIGDDVQHYSRTNQHDSVKISTNRLTGLRIQSRDLLTDDGDYAPQPEVREKVDTAPIYMGTAPDPAVTLGLGGE